MKLKELASLAGLKIIGPDRDLPMHFCVDSRQVKEGDGFAAIQGEHVDGHRFLNDVLRTGASVVLGQAEKIGEDVISQWPDCTFVLSRIPAERALASLAHERLRDFRNLKDLVAITGSVGKTSTKNNLFSLLDDKFKTFVSNGNLNTLIGCALTVLETPVDSEILILEMGANHPGEIAEMVNAFPPTLAAITEVTAVHLQGFGSVEGVLNAKTEILNSPKLRFAAVNADNTLLLQRCAQLIGGKVIPFGKNGKVSFSNERLSWKEDHFQVDAVLSGLDGLSFNISLPLAGVHQLYPLCCALTLAELAGMKSTEIAPNISRCHSGVGRGQIRVSASGAAVLDECYNASPAAMRATLASLKAVDVPGRKILVLGEMLELGTASKEEHQSLLNQALTIDAALFLIGDAWKQVPGAAEHFYTSLDALVDALVDISPQKGDLVLVKGSRGNRLENVLNALEP